EPPIRCNGLYGVVALEEPRRSSLQPMPQGELRERNAHDLLEKLAEGLSAERADVGGFGRREELAALENELHGLVDARVRVVGQGRGGRGLVHLRKLEKDLVKQH